MPWSSSPIVSDPLRRSVPPGDADMEYAAIYSIGEAVSDVRCLVLKTEREVRQ